MDVNVEELELLPLPDVAERLDLPITRVHQLVNDGDVIALRVDGAPIAVPAPFLS